MTGFLKWGVFSEPQENAMTMLNDLPTQQYSPDFDEFAEDWTARASIYKLLSRLFLEEITPQFLEVLRNPDIQNLFGQAGFSFSEYSLDGPADSLVEEFAEGYCATFVIPMEMALYPFESCHREGCLLGESTQAVEDIYRQHGFGIPEEGGAIADHIGFEFDFMAKLVEKLEECLENNEMENAAHLYETQRDFLRNHLLAWAPRFAKHVEKMSVHPFYRDLGKATFNFLTFEAKDYGLSIQNHDDFAL